MTISGIVAHGVNAIHAIIDITFISAMPVIILHIYVPLIFVVVYGIFNAIFDMAGGLGSNGERFVYEVGVVVLDVKLFAPLLVSRRFSGRNHFTALIL